jgi:hypothetical protein
VRHGVRGVKLEALFFGGRLTTTAEALERFGKAVVEVTRDKEPTSPGSSASSRSATAPRLPPRRAKAIEGARNELEEAGI